MFNRWLLKNAVTSTQVLSSNDVGPYPRSLDSNTIDHQLDRSWASRQHSDTPRVLDQCNFTLSGRAKGTQKSVQIHKKARCTLFFA